MTAIAQNWAMHAVHLLWQGTVVGLLLLAVVRLFPRTAPRFRHALVSLAMLKLVIPPMLPLPTGLFSAVPPVPEMLTVAQAVHGTDARILLALMLVHAAGTAFMLMRLAAEAWRLRRVCTEAEDGGGFLISDEIRVPMTTGRRILIPRFLVETLTAAELDDVLAHEREHIRRSDVPRGLADAFVVALWWFHPLVHLLAREARTLREEACDDALIASGKCTSGHYARTLLRASTYAGGATPAAVAAVAESPHELLRRIRRMTAGNFAPTSRLGTAATLIVILAAFLLLPGLRVSRSNRLAFDHATRHALHGH